MDTQVVNVTVQPEEQVIWFIEQEAHFSEYSPSQVLMSASLGLARKVVEVHEDDPTARTAKNNCELILIHEVIAELTQCAP